jgi:hypothetical protein
LETKQKKKKVFTANQTFPINIVTCLLKPELLRQKRQPFLGNGSVNTFPWQSNHMTATIDTHAAQEEVVLLEHCNQNPDLN